MHYISQFGMMLKINKNRSLRSTKLSKTAATFDYFRARLARFGHFRAASWIFGADSAGVAVDRCARSRLSDSVAQCFVQNSAIATRLCALVFRDKCYI